MGREVGEREQSNGGREGGRGKANLHKSEEAAATPRAPGVGGVVKGAGRVEGAEVRGREEGREGGREEV